jgi:hypothetical protein
MKQKILISSIIRNRAKKLERYFYQINNFVNHLKNDYDFSISIYENDSVDDSKKILKFTDYSIFDKKYVKCENINTQYYGSVIDSQRVINFANARNQTLERVDRNYYDWLLIIEPDIIYNTNFAEEIITRKNLNFNPDIYSGVLMMNNIPYDLWGMRRTSNEEWGGLYPDHKQNPVCEFWSTANGFCLYNMKPFKEGLNFSAFNKRLNKYDCDTAVLCEDFRSLGYNKIFINQSLSAIHDV